MARIPLGEDRGWIELHTSGRAEVFSADYPDDPVFVFNAEDGDLLAALASELGSMGETWQKFKLETPEYTNPARTTGNMYDNQGDEEEELDEATPGKITPAPDQPQLVGMAAPKVATAEARRLT